MALHAYLKGIQRVVLIELNQIGQEQWDAKLIKRTTLLKCFSSWVTLTYDKDVIASTPGHFIMQAALANIGDHSIGDECADCVYDVLNTAKNPSVDSELFAFLTTQISSFSR